MASSSLIFLRQLITNPRRVSAIAPSSAFLARAMAFGIGPKTGRVVEFGPGTGKLTDGILRAGLPPQNLTLIELDPSFVGYLKTRFPEASVLQVGADTAAAHVAPGVERVISGLPLLSMPFAVRAAIIGAAFEILAPKGVYVQFTYGQNAALSEAELAAMGLKVANGAKVWLNLPPARVQYYTRIADRV
jgi:phosphatidylethanolamine/phosphatidyl-N-methylethanolamine N-methyltransferase